MNPDMETILEFLDYRIGVHDPRQVEANLPEASGSRRRMTFVTTGNPAMPPLL